MTSYTPTMIRSRGINSPRRYALEEHSATSLLRREHHKARNRIAQHIRMKFFQHFPHELGDDGVHSFEIVSGVQ